MPEDLAFSEPEETPPVRPAPVEPRRAAGRLGTAAVARSELAWMRAALSVVVTSTLLVKHALTVGGTVGLCIGAVVMVAGAVAAYAPVRRHVVTSEGGAVRVGAIRAATAVAVGIGVLSLVVLLIPAR